MLLLSSLLFFTIIVFFYYYHYYHVLAFIIAIVFNDCYYEYTMKNILFYMCPKVSSRLISDLDPAVVTNLDLGQQVEPASGAVEPNRKSHRVLRNNGG